MTNVADELRKLGVTGALITAAEAGRIQALECQIPGCLCPDELGGNGYFEPIPEPLSDWMPTLDHYPKLKHDGGHRTVDNVRLAHRICNRVDFARATGRSIARDLARVENVRKEVIERNRFAADSTLGSLFDQALTYTTHLHRWQIRKGSQVPYVSHLLGVVSLVIEEGGSETQTIAALLHDAVEDQGGQPRLDEIRERYGVEVADIVLACTDSLEEPKPPWRERKEHYLAHLPEAPADALLVSIADKVHNARSILMDLRSGGVGVFDRFTGGREGTLWYYRTLATTYRSIDGFGSRLIDEFDRAVNEIESLGSG